MDSDCKSLILKINPPIIHDSTLGSLVEDIKELSKGFGKILFVYCPRNVNIAADMLAKYGLSLRSNKVWFPGYPDCIHHIVLADSSI